MDFTYQSLGDFDVNCLTFLSICSICTSEKTDFKNLTSSLLKVMRFKLKLRELEAKDLVKVDSNESKVCRV